MEGQLSETRPPTAAAANARPPNPAGARRRAPVRSTYAAECAAAAAGSLRATDANCAGEGQQQMRRSRPPSGRGPMRAPIELHAGPRAACRRGSLGGCENAPPVRSERPLMRAYRLLHGHRRGVHAPG
eukprot:scaffold1535_cov382-Prasinococcus_capsulatus_cf.AAC.42